MDDVAVAAKLDVLRDEMPRTPDTWPCDCLLADTTTLARLHEDQFGAREARIAFAAATHAYFVDGQLVPLSVTGFVGAPFDPFLPGRALADLSNGAAERWHERYGDVSILSVAQQWDETRAEAARLGTKMHAAIEVFFNTGILSSDEEITTEMQQFHEFVTHDLGWLGVTCVRTEMRIFAALAAGLVLAGSVDFVGRVASTGEYWLLDWKRVREIRTGADGRRGFCAPPLQAFEQVDVVKYSLQLHTYRAILMRCYNLRIPTRNLFMVTFHRDRKRYGLHPAVDLSAQVVDMMHDYPQWLARAQRNRAHVLTDAVLAECVEHASDMARALDVENDNL